MSKNEISILSTKNLSGNLIEYAASNGILLECIPFIKIEPANSNLNIDKFLDKNIAVVFTSMNSVKIIANQLTNSISWKIYCIGHATKVEVLKYFSKENIVATADYGEDLADKIILNGERKILFFCGSLRRDVIPDKMAAHGINVTEIVVYNTFKTPVSLTKKYSAVLFFSPSGVDSFFSINKLNSAIAVAIGTTTAAELKKFTNQNIIISKIPSVESMINSLIELKDSKQLLC